MLAALGWSAQTLHHRMVTGGISLAFTAPIDVLYAATAIDDRAYAASEAQLQGTDPPDESGTLTEIRATAADEANPALLALAAAADAAGVTLLWDDDEVSLGTGSGARTWPARALPNPAVAGTLTEGAAGSAGTPRPVPIGLITGTNGKTTTARLARHIARCAGRTPGLTSTDGSSRRRRNYRTG
ncbi:MAG: hypothetical protein U5K76_02275 [Woeseiaceae bacterium]|nr:hypothetical protein [Woeseiaceae bacterium]